MKKMWFALFVTALLSLMISSSYAQEKKIKFKYCRVEILKGDEGYVIDNDGLIVFGHDMIVMKSNNENSDATFVIAKEVAPQIDSHKAWLVYNSKAPSIPIILELGEGDGVKLSVVGTNDQSFFFSIERGSELQELPEKNVWYAFPRKGGDLREIN